MEHNTQQSKHSTSRRSFLRKGLAVGGAGAIGAGLLANGLSLPAFAEESSSSLTKGDVAILRLLAAVEIIESDLWQQYNELGGIQDSEVPTNWEASRTAKSKGEAAVLPTSLACSCWMGTCFSISATTPKMSSAT